MLLINIVSSTEMGLALIKPLIDKIYLPMLIDSDYGRRKVVEIQIVDLVLLLGSVPTT